MPAPTQPTLSLTRASSTSFLAALSGDNSGTTYSLYGKKIWSGTFELLGTRTNSGSLTVSGLEANVAYVVYAVASNGEYSLPAVSYVSLNEADSLAAAIKRKWDALPSLVTLAGNLFTQEVPENLEGEEVVLPYSWINIGSSKFDWTFETLYFEHTDVDFYILVKGLETAEQAASEFRTQFDWEALTFDDPLNKCLIVAPTDYQLSKEFLSYKDGYPVHSVKVSYHVCTERHLPS